MPISCKINLMAARSPQFAGVAKHARDHFGPAHDERIPPADSVVYVCGGRLPLEPGFHMHYHEGMEVGVVVSGRMDLVFGDTVFPCTPGDVFLSAMWEPHGWHTTAAGATNLGIIFRLDFLGNDFAQRIPWLSPFAAPAAQRPRVTTSHTRERVLVIARFLLQETTERDRGWVEVVRAGLQWLLVELIRDWHGPDRPKGVRSDHPSPNDLARIMPAVALVQDDAARVVRASEAAAACNLSLSRFQVIFRSTMGISFARFRLRSRLAFCAHRLLTTDLPIEAIADQAGFVDRSHLHRAFVRQYGCTPGQFREQQRMPGLYRARLAPPSLE